MSGYEFTELANDDLLEIWSFIARDDIDSANRVEEAILASCALLARTPRAGQVRRDLTSLPVRIWTVQPYVNYRIIYDPSTGPIRILRILHAARDTGKHLR